MAMPELEEVINPKKALDRRMKEAEGAAESKKQESVPADQPGGISFTKKWTDEERAEQKKALIRKLRNR